MVLSCLECTVTVDANNGTLGIGDAHCWDASDHDHRHGDGAVNCPSQQCYTHVLAEWRPKGGLLYSLTRGCVTDDITFPEGEDYVCKRSGSLTAYQRRGQCHFIN